MYSGTENIVVGFLALCAAAVFGLGLAVGYLVAN